ncbi:MAG: beta-ketoacyl synthase N-terminal-like domain-containing protein [Thermodesulfobacteriota bacterium]|nr:beta-ketoacyl synthase N-terminal-like domain-containing protein [Thermodesulfobacteriota bacterium]
MKERATEEIAIIGMACNYPQAPDLNTFWQNIINKVDAITDVPPDRWNKDLFYNPKTADGTKLYSKRGGYLGSPFPFDPARYGVMPLAVEGGEPDQFLVLKIAYDAMADAGYLEKTEDEAKVEFILGRGNYIGVGAMSLIQRTLVIEQTLKIIEKLGISLSEEEFLELRRELLASLPPFRSETAPAVMPNITASRVANRLGFICPNYTIDAACASSLLAVDIASRHLQSGYCDMALAGGVHIFNTVPFLNVFCALGSMSRREIICPFDKKADGLLPGEGVGIVVLKRMKDAQRDGDRIYAVIKGVGSSSDGRAVSVTAPRVEGEMLALSRAYEMAGISPSTVGLIEAHGTATSVGDAVEVEALTRIFGTRVNDAVRNCAMGSVKSMIGHTMPAAGVAGLIKASLAIYYKVLPPTLNCDEPNPKFQLEKTPFYINTETRPWFHGHKDFPRRAGVNAFGFGGVNAHVVLEEYSENGTMNIPPDMRWDTEVFIFCGKSREEMLDRGKRTVQLLEKEPFVNPGDLSYTLAQDMEGSSHRLSIVAESAAALNKKLDYAISRLSDPECKKIKDIKGIYYFSSPLGNYGKIAFLFPGEGSPYPNMMLDLCLNFPEVRRCFEQINRAISTRIKKSKLLPTQFIFPMPLSTKKEFKELERKFWKIDSGLQSVLASNFAMNAILNGISIKPDMIIGHSAGEYVAWMAAGILDQEEFYKRQEMVSNIYTTDNNRVETAMVAVSAGREKIEEILKDVRGKIFVTNDNCPHQVVVVGEIKATAQFTETLGKNKIMHEELPSKEAHHTPLSADYAGPLLRCLSTFSISSPKIPIYSATTASVYPDAPSKILDLMVEYWLKPLEFQKTIKTMYNDGARIFIEVGPGANLTAFVDDTLRGKSYLAVPSNNRRRSGIAQLCHLIGILAAQHVPLSLSYLYKYRTLKEISPGVLQDKQHNKRKKSLLYLPLGLPEIHLQNFKLPEEKKHIEPDPKQFIEEVIPASVKTDRSKEPEASDKNLLSLPDRSQIMQSYLENMQSFLDTQQEVMNSYLKKKSSLKNLHTHKEKLPFIGEVISLIPQKRCRIKRRIDLDEDIFLYDHPFGGDISESNRKLSPLVVLPLTVNVEIMVEAASLLFPDKIPVAVKDIKANRWIAIEDESAPILYIEANILPASPSEATVKIAVMDKKEGPHISEQVPAFESTVVFMTQYPSSVNLEPVDLKADWKSSPHSAREVYEQKFMPHGPSFQVLKSLDRCLEKVIFAHLQSPEENRLFYSLKVPRLLANPMILDACAQLTGYWAQQNLKDGFITFPRGVKNIQFYTGPPLPSEKLTCRMWIKEITFDYVTADLEIIRNDGRLWAKIYGWVQKRFRLPDELYKFWKFPRDFIISRQWDVVKPELSDTLNCFCFKSGYYPDLNNTIWKKSIAYLYLNDHERKIYNGLPANTGRGNEWLAGRMAAKDAIRVLLNKMHGIKVYPADIEISYDTNGKPIPEGDWISGINNPLFLSISHGDEFAVATAALSDKIFGQGVDIQMIEKRSNELEKEAFIKDELKLFKGFNPHERVEWITRFWCAKEAAGKALGYGLIYGPKTMVVTEFNLQTGVITLVLAGKLAEKIQDKKVDVLTLKDGEYIIAFCFYRKELN